MSSPATGRFRTVNEISKTPWWYVPGAAGTMAAAFSRHEPGAGLMRVITYPVYLSLAFGAKLRGRLYQQNHAVGIVNDLKPSAAHRVADRLGLLIVLFSPFLVASLFDPFGIWWGLALAYAFVPVLAVRRQGSRSAEREMSRKKLAKDLGPSGVELSCIARGKKSASGDGKLLIQGLAHQYQQNHTVGLVAHTDKHLTLYALMGFKRIGTTLAMKYPAAGE
ncbi:hypothetical protein ACLQ8T_16730 (plasmid) [Glutamicibacter sp. FR1]|uniref:hypothetical protein n=1 Tax=Glutamicibacter sp. FR1 TaxID=3393744 RepID=UPI0039B07E6D